MNWNQYGPDFDFPAFTGRVRHYLLATLPRSGSHFLANLLFQTGVAGCPHEYFNPIHLKAWRKKLETADETGTLAAIRAQRTAPSGLFGVKSHWPHFTAIRDRLPDDMVFERAVHITRANTIAQAVSLVIAQQTKAWISHHEPVGEPAYDRDAIEAAIHRIKQQEAAWNTHFQACDLPVLRLEYEALVNDPAGTVETVTGFLGVSFDRCRLDLEAGPRKQAGALNETWERRFRSGS